MKPRAFLIHWKKEDLAPKVKLLRSLGYTVATEHEDGARAGKAIIQRPPDVIVIYLTRLPSHGSATAEYLAERKSTRHIPIVFVGGEAEKVTKVKERVPSGLYTSEEKLKLILNQFT